ncbi:LytR/AlgR family response regulator transcription factor [Sediminitomix flava]|uniref:LytTR family two component transcriptional regulator n=1 Tax=Sediminitomix flava TaxID=379075 RepID=A0A315ZIT9_SEDFL|nr:response regulator transcription factor [Sediminitomix flava]PWJ44738.1 LytTR family two component transcriptional regulator [Sediminitomix flava]
MTPLKLIIVEDDLVVAKSLIFTLEDLGYEVSSSYRKGEDLLAQIHQLDTDLILLDIELLGELDGIATAEKIRNEFDGPIIYLTSKDDHVTFERAKHTKPSAFLKKPFDVNTLRASIELAVHNHQGEEVNEKVEIPSSTENRYAVTDGIFVKSRSKFLKLKIEDILYIKANDIYASVFTNTGNFLVNYALKHLEEKLPIPPFYRVHRSYIVNIEKVTGLEDNHLLIGDEHIPIGKTYREEIMQCFKIL